MAETARRDDADATAGKEARTTTPRRDHARFDLPERDPVAVVEAQNDGRVQDLVPIRMGRMLQSPFAFYRGSAALMTLDLAAGTRTGFDVLACGDAHVANFGFFASPERRLVFDLNDFDEAYPAPWEWDVKRMAASCWLGSRNAGLDEDACREAALSSVRGYRETVRELFELSTTERYYFGVEASDLLEYTREHGGSGKLVEATEKKARKRTSERVLRRLTVTGEGGRLRVTDQPPIVTHPEGMPWDRLEALVGEYRRTVRPDVALVLSQYELVDFARRVVGVGSVGTRCWIILLVGPSGDPLFLQAKEAGPSVLASHGPPLRNGRTMADVLVADGQGRRVVTAQRILQAQSDPFLGWLHGIEGIDGQHRDFYVRQFRDMKGSFVLESLGARQYAAYGRLCGALLARGHSQSPGSRFVAGYLGRSDAFDEAVADWAGRYADQAEADHAALERAVRSGRVAAERDA